MKCEWCDGEAVIRVHVYFEPLGSGRPCEITQVEGLHPQRLVPIGGPCSPSCAQCVVRLTNGPTRDGLGLPDMDAAMVERIAKALAL